MSDQFQPLDYPWDLSDWLNPDGEATCMLALSQEILDHPQSWNDGHTLVHGLDNSLNYDRYPLGGLGPSSHTIHAGLTLNTGDTGGDSTIAAFTQDTIAPANVEKVEETFLVRSLYSGSNCATCAAPLSTSDGSLATQDLYCTDRNGLDHAALACIYCEFKCNRIRELRVHQHRSFQCAVPGCGESLHVSEEYLHFKRNHPEIKYRCSECHQGFDTADRLENHGKNASHGAFVCRFSGCTAMPCARLADLERHQLVHMVNVQRYPCTHCRKYRGKNGFKREDHLRQHIRNYHHIEDSDDKTETFDCPRNGCDKIEMNAFKDKKSLKLHLRKDHDSPHGCRHPGCNRNGTKGYQRHIDLIKHIKKAHADAQLNDFLNTT